MSSDKKTIDEETTRIKQLLQDQEKEIKEAKDNYEKLLDLFDNVKKNVADVIKDNLPEILKKALEDANIDDDVKDTVIEKSGEVITKLNEKVKGIGVEEETNVLKNIQRTKSTNTEIPENIEEIVKKKSFDPINKIKDKILEALRDHELDKDEKKDLLNNDKFNPIFWREKNFNKHFGEALKDSDYDQQEKKELENFYNYNGKDDYIIVPHLWSRKNYDKFMNSIEGLQIPFFELKTAFKDIINVNTPIFPDRFYSVQKKMSYSVKQKVELAAEAARLAQLLEDQERELDVWKDVYNKLFDKIGKVKDDITKAVEENLPTILNDALKEAKIGDDIKKTIIDETAKVISEIDKNQEYDDLQKQIDDLKNTKRG
ncbi:6208_t:CDS:2 [Scutellospora calospora]|uniref:6208_t:CDS:1 n=1 Tax=Scutellospora calospora TaxID=85575 RepID=A0ACA9LIN8_9GLOM|nr:6208_t:CDS:2 [Scutellospora calospora]